MFDGVGFFENVLREILGVGVDFDWAFFRFE